MAGPARDGSAESSRGTVTVGPRGFWATWLAVVLRPWKLFAEERASWSGWRPLPFALATGALAMAGGSLLQGRVPGAVVWLFLSPLAVIAGVYLTAWLVHAVLRLSGGTPHGFRMTRDATCFAYGATLLSAIPVVGIVAALWWLVVLVIAVRAAQGVSTPRAVLGMLTPLAVPVVLALVLRLGVVEAFKIPSGGMWPTLERQDHIFADKLAYGPAIPLTSRRLYFRRPRYGDVAVFQYPDPDPSRPRQDFVKRVIALPGDTLEVRSGHPIINGWRVPSCPVGEATVDDEQAHGRLELEWLGPEPYLVFYEDERDNGDQGPYRVAKGEFWVLGDNRNNSADSRFWNDGRGAGVPFGLVKGRVWSIWLAFDASGKVDWTRMHELHGPPRLPAGSPAALRDGLARCLAAPPERTTPPAP